MIFTIALGYIMNSVGGLNVPIYHFAIMGLILPALSQFGDLVASAIKRDSGIKDFGTIMPGHGGIMDRLDSSLFISPIVYFYYFLFIV